MAYKFLRKAAVLLLCTVLIICTGTLAFASFGDTESSNAKSEIDFIASYGIMKGYEDGNFYPENAITRAEMVAVALRLLRLDDPVSDGALGQTYSDVPTNHWAYGVIETASSLGIVNGYTDGTFLPDKYVTYQEAIKIFVTILGYEPVAKAKGGWPQGYLAVSMNEELISLSGISVTDSATRAAIAVMAYNTLQTNMMLASYYENDNINYTVSEQTMLDIYFKSQEGEGVVTATWVEGLNGEDAGEGRIEINNEIYLCDIDYADLLGNKVKFFYRDENGVKKIVSVVEDAVHQNKLKVNSEMMEAFIGMYTEKGSFTYYKSKKPRKLSTVSLSPAMSLIYNNEYIPYNNIGAVDLDNIQGTIELIDIDMDNVYDYVKVLSYKDYYVNNVSTSEETRYITDGVGAGLVYETEDIYEKITKDGSKIEFSDIPQGCIVSAAVSADKKAVEIILSTNEVSGTITSKSEDDGTITLWIDEVEYTVSKAIPASYIVDTLNTSGTFKLNFLGQLVYCSEEGDDGESYGYLTTVGKKDGGISTGVEVRMLTPDNKFVILDVADKVKFYDKGELKTVSANEIYDKFYHKPVYNDIREALTQVVKYKLNQDGELALLRTAAETPSTEEFSYGYINPVSGEAEGRRYYSNRLFLQKYQITDDTVCFQIPWREDGEDYTRFNSGSAPTYFSDGNYYQVLLFDVNEEKQVGAIMYTIYGQEKEFFFKVDSNSPVMIVDGVRYVNDKETGLTNAVISGLVEGEYTSIAIDEEFLPSMSSNMFKFGSVIQYDTNKSKVKAAYYDGEEPSLAAATLLCADGKTAKTIKWNGGNVEMNSANRKTTYGTVQKIVGFTVTVNIPDYPYGNEADYFLADSTQVIIVNAEEKTMKLGTFYDIHPSDRIFIRQRYNRIRDVVIYR